jgi:uncharacterized protein (DUF1015 family)
MVAIKPFKGYRYDVEDISKVICPPYDVISKDHQKTLLELSPHNFVRLILGDDPEVEECKRDVSRITRLFEEWIDEGVLHKEERDSIYVYSQTFDAEGEPKRRTGIIPSVTLEEFREKNIYPHEKVMSKHVEDRYALMEATQANFGMVFGIYADPAREVDRLVDEILHDKPISSCTMDEVLHELWKIDDEALIERLRREMEAKQVYIADGHHRYTTALRYRNAHPEREEAKYVVMTLVNMYNEGLVIFPTHRLVKRARHDVKRILKGIEENFHIEPTTRAQMMDRIHGKKFSYGFYCDGDYYVIRLRKGRALDTILPSPSEALRQLDVTVLHEMILKPIFQIDTEDEDIQEKITYMKSLPAAMTKLSTDEYAFGFFLNAVNMDEIVRVASDNEVMPQKSTFFYPKVYSGLVVHRLE